MDCGDPVSYPYEPTHGWGPDLHEVLAQGHNAWGDEYQASKYADDYECCIVCGRRTTSERGIAVVLGGGSDSLIDPRDMIEAEDADPGFMGVWLIGPECGRRIPVEYRVTKEVKA
jgi:hypothetical protein